MVSGEHVALRPIRDDDWDVIEAWGRHRQGLWGRFQRLQLDHLPALREAYGKTHLLRRESGFLLVETVQEHRPVGFVRYTLIHFPDSDLPYPEIGFGVEPASRGNGYAQEAVRLLVEYLFDGYPVERVAAFTDVENLASQRVLEKMGFQREGVLRRATFRDGRWCDLAIYGLLRSEWCETVVAHPGAVPIEAPILVQALGARG